MIAELRNAFASPEPPHSERRRASSPTRRSASAARRARSPASSGTSSRRTAYWTGNSYDNTAASAARPGGTSPSSSSSTAAADRRGPLADDERRVQALRQGAGVMEACPTGAIIRTEFGTVVVQQDICNGCGYCVPACPFGVIERNVRRPRAQVHALLRPPEGRPGAGLREGLPDRFDPVRPD